jgi:hypothetical protein
MRTFIRNLLFKGNKPSQFVGIGVLPNAIPEKVVLEHKDGRCEVSDRHWIVCQTPFTVGIFFNPTDRLVDDGELIVFLNEVKAASITLKKSKAVPLGSAGYLGLYVVSGVTCHQLGVLHRLSLLLYFFAKRKNKHSFDEARSFCALYSFPRKVIVTSFRDDRGYNLFPMDFQGDIPGSDLYVLGLRHSNVTLSGILERKAIVVANVSIEDLRSVYYLGAHHSSHPPALHELPFATIKSSLYEFYLPEFTSSYRELQIIDSVDLGSHMLMIARVVNFQRLKAEGNCLHHLHFIQFLERRNRRIQELQVS